MPFLTALIVTAKPNIVKFASMGYDNCKSLVSKTQGALIGSANYNRYLTEHKVPILGGINFIEPNVVNAVNLYWQ